MIRAILALVVSIMKSVGRWCERTKKWVVEQGWQPAVDLPGQMLRGAGALLEGGGRLAGASLSAAAALPGALAAGLASSRTVPPPPSPGGQGSDAAEEVAEALDEIRVRRITRDTLRAMQSEAPVSLEAKFVHRFASADRAGRADLDLEELPPHLQEWLRSLSVAHLAHLAQSPELCELAVSGRRTGLVGMPLPERIAPTHVFEEAGSGRVKAIGEMLGDRDALAARLAAAKGIRSDRHPIH